MSTLAHKNLALSNLPKFVRERLQFEEKLKTKRELTLFLTELIEDFFSSHKLELSHKQVVDSYQDIPEWRIDTVLAKLRSLMELNAKKDLRVFCADLSEKTKKQARLLLRQAALYNFRDSLDLDLYVGVHTAISAYFKMIGVALFTTSTLATPVEISMATKDLFKSLRFVASLPLRYLMAFDGLFWDSKQYFIPKSFAAEISNGEILFSLPTDEIEKRLQSIRADEEQIGCPALRARTNLGESIFEIVEKACLNTAKEFFIDFHQPILRP